MLYINERGRENEGTDKQDKREGTEEKWTQGEITKKWSKSTRQRDCRGVSKLTFFRVFIKDESHLNSEVNQGLFVSTFMVVDKVTLSATVREDGI